MPFTKKTRVKIRRVIALFMLFTILNQIFVPSVAFALTAGPTAPEATNFEPIDTTDMVNPLTGDFTYGLPLLEVPGPEGSYPLALSYHAAIQPNEEASWVGLGWSLNPGAIARNVNGYPDDWQNKPAVSRAYWAGGSTSTTNIGVAVGLPGNVASINFGLSFAQDTYRGFGVGWSLGGSVALGWTPGVAATSTTAATGPSGISPFSAGVTIGVSPWGDDYVGVDVGFSHGIMGQSGLKGSVSIGVQTNFKSVSSTFSEGLGSPGGSLLGASISSSGNGAHLSVGGGSATSVNNANAGKISTQTTSWAFTIPTPVVSLSVSYSHVRYWSDESTTVGVNGVIYNHLALSSISQMDLYEDDNYQLPDFTNPSLNFVQNPDPSTQAGGTYPDFDNYSVTAQGLSGYMRPYIFQAPLYKQNKMDNVNTHLNDIHADAIPVVNLPSKWQFRFINDFSNYYGQQSPYTSDNLDVGYDFDLSPKYGNNDGTYGYDPASNRLEGSKHIEYFTNAQISNGTAAARGFIDCPDQGQGGFTRSSYDGSQIGGFMITNESGVTYHYALPAYEGSEFIHTELIHSISSTYNNLHKPALYAYTWYLTAITGPDYVGRGIAMGTTTRPGTIDAKNDWGYWVKFDYGQWTNNYQWRTPSQGFNVDLDNNFQTFSSGTKEVYYLDAIETRSHTAIFEKEIRADGKDATGFGRPATIDCSTSSTTYTASSLRLNNIYLFQNDQLPLSIDAIRNSNTLYQQVNTIYNSSQDQDGTPHSCSVAVQPVNGQNVIDKYDIDPAWAANCLRKISLNYDYSLCPGVPNSYDPGGLNTYFNQNVANNSASGKLTLLSVDMQGKGGAPMTPPIQFQYDLDPTDAKNQDNITYAAPTGTSVTQNGNSITLYTGTITTQTSTKFRPGDILSFQAGSTTYYCTILAATDGTNTNFNVRYLNNAPPGAGSSTPAVKTKNPPYNKDAYDMWGCYKSDYVAGSNNENLSRITTPVSNIGTDAWSLRKILSSLGANITINYEGDTYNRSVLSKDRSLIIPDNNNTSIIRNAAQDYTFYPNTEGLDLTKIYNVGDQISMVYTIQDQPGGGNWLVRNTGTSAQVPLGSNYTHMGSNYDPSQWVNPNPEAQKINAPIVKAVGINWVEVTTNLGVEEDFYAYFARVEALIGGSSPQYLNFGTANIELDGAALLYGGGLRVKDIIVDDLNGNINKTSYNYRIPGALATQATSSGVTAYEPIVFDADNMANYPAATIKSYRNVLYQYHSQMLAIAREMPAPGVTYEYIAVTDSTILPTGQRIPVDGKTLYQYEVFRPEMIGVNLYNPESYMQENNTSIFVGTNDPDYTINTRTRNNIAIKDYTSRIGNLRRVITYDNAGNKLTEKITHYLHDDLDNTSFQNQITTYEPRLAAYNNIGVIQERYGSIRLAVASVNSSNVPTTYNEIWAMSNKETFPAIQIGTTQIDYKNGTRMDQSNLAYDFYTGAVTKTLTTDSYGNRFISQVIPAYTEYPALGLMTHDDDPGATQHKQMLSQQASTYTFSVDGSNNPIGVVTATVQTWSNSTPVLDQDGNSISGGQPNIWRMGSNYQWMPSGSSTNNVAPYSSFVDYYASGGSNNASWKKTAQITKYNVYSAALEATDINSNYAATRMGYNNGKVLLTGGPAQYNEIAYAGVEDALLGTGYFSNNISPGSGTVVMDSTKSHTGTHSLLVAAAQNGFTYTLANAASKNYSVAVWVKPTVSNVSQAQLYYQVGSGAVVTPTQNLAKTAAGWYLLEMTVPSTALTGENLVVGCKNGSSADIYFDDFRFQPTSASTTAYVYDNQTGELTYILGNNNLYVRYQYDAIGRLVRTYREVLGKANVPLARSIAYNYGRSSSSNWQNTGTTRCQQANGSNDGYLDVQQKDANPLSPTYNQLQWVATTTTSSGCPVNIYARLDAVSGSSTVTGNIFNYGIYTVRLFSDAGGTVPYTLTSPLTVNYIVQQYITDANSNPYSQTHNELKIGSAGQNTISIGEVITQRLNTSNLNPFDSGGGSSGGQIPPGSVAPYGYNATVSLSSGSGYTITTAGH
jgi:hypothetical protein